MSSIKLKPKKLKKIDLNEFSNLTCLNQGNLWDKESNRNKNLSDYGVYLYRNYSEQNIFYCLTYDDLENLLNFDNSKGVKVEYIGKFGKGDDVKDKSERDNDDLDMTCNEIFGSYKEACQSYFKIPTSLLKGDMSQIEDLNIDEIIDLANVAHKISKKDLRECVKNREIYKNVCLYKKKVQSEPDESHEKPIKSISWILSQNIKVSQKIMDILHKLKINYNNLEEMSEKDIQNILKFIKDLKVSTLKEKLLTELQSRKNK